MNLVTDSIKDKLVNEIMLIDDVKILKIIYAYTAKLKELNTVGVSNE